MVRSEGEGVYEAVRAVWNELSSNGEAFYYVTLVLTEEGFGPTFSAWSIQALQRESIKHSDDKDFTAAVKWSYADSPYHDFGGDRFRAVRDQFNARPSLRELGLDRWQYEINFRISLLIAAMQRLDAEGAFSRNQPRGDILVAVELMPPVARNVEIVSRLNDVRSEAFRVWLDEAAEVDEE